MTGAPAGFDRIEKDGVALVLRGDVAPALRRAGIDDPAALAARAGREFAGRGRPFALDVADVGPVFVRAYQHGGLAAPLTGDRYLGDGRFEDELAALVDAAAAGVPVPEALGFVSRSAGPGLRRGWLLTREVAGAQDLLAVLGGGGNSAARRAALREGGRACRLLHDAGFEHRDLHAKNLLVTPGGRVLVLDLDASRRHAAALDEERRLAGLFRFDRYLARRAHQGATRTDRLRFLRAYAGEDWPARARLRELAARLARHIARHGTPLSRGPAAARRAPA